LFSLDVQEYPNDPGAGQPYGSADSANLLTFFTYLRKSLGTSAIISATTPDTVWLGANGNPITSGLAAYAAQMTYVNIMCV
jgi:chitinase